MKDRRFKSAVIVGSSFLWVNLVQSVFAGENIIQQEKMSFDRCLKVITTSESKLSIAPVIKDVSSDKRVAIFTLTDGTLSITCDGNKGLVTVSTAEN